MIGHLMSIPLLLAAKVVVELGKCGLIEAAVFLHPSLVTVDDVKGKSFNP